MGAGTVLVVDDDREHLNVVSRILAKDGHVIRSVASADAALELLNTERADVVVSDLDMPTMNGLDLLREIKVRWMAQPVVMMSGLGSVDMAVEAVQHGASDFIPKPIEFGRLREAVMRALSLREGDIEEPPPSVSRASMPDLVGESPPMVALKRLIRQVAPVDCRVLIQGENGTGKELVANAIHAGSQRRDRPFVKVNCGALSSTLLESELFGHERGAFTGASSRRQGRFELAHRGTLLLDEVGELPLEAQVRLLRVIQEGEFERVGGSQTLRCDVRILAATNKDLAEMVDRGTFREDLFYRLNVVTLNVPALRNRRGDIPLLIEHLLSKEDPKRRIILSNDGRAQLVSREYPGNVRELQNLIERLNVLRASAEVSPIDIEDLAPAKRSRGPSIGPHRIFQQGVNYRDRLLQLERMLIVEALEEHAGSKSSAAQSLGTDKSFFYRKCRQFGID